MFSVIFPFCFTILLPTFFIFILSRRFSPANKRLLRRGWWIVLGFSLLIVCNFFFFSTIEIVSRFNNEGGTSDDSRTAVYGAAPGARYSYKALIDKYANQYNIDPTLIAAIIQAESAGDPTAVSSSGALGVMQIMPIVQSDQCPAADLFDPEQNIACGVKHFKWTLDQMGGDTDRAIMAYHAGVTGLKQNGPRPIDQQYLSNVKAAWGSASADRSLVAGAMPTAVPDTKQTAYLSRADLQRLAGLLLGSKRTPLSQAASGDSDDWGPIYVSGTVSQWSHGFSYGHAAIDIASGCGRPIRSPINATYAKRFTDGLANTVLILGNDIYEVTLMHGNYIATAGDGGGRVIIPLGAVVGTEASIGNSTGCHTHINAFDKRVGQNVNPYNLGLTVFSDN